MSRTLTHRGGRILLSTFITLVLHTSPALAHDHHGHYENNYSHGYNNWHDDDDDRYDDHHDYRPQKTVIYRTSPSKTSYVRIVIDEDERNLARYYLEKSYRYDCPPGLSRRDGCVPSGYSRRYVIGQPLPPTVIWRTVPTHVLYNLPPAPHGTYYAYADRDLVLLSEATKKVLDAVVLLSATH